MTSAGGRAVRSATSATSTRWGDHLLEHILPWWEARAVDEVGGVLTAFDNAGRLTSTDRFTWSQGRWAWVAAELAEEAAAGRLALDAEVWRRRSHDTCELMLRHAVRPDGRTHFVVTQQGEPAGAGETATSVFADLFAVLGLAGGLRSLPPDDVRREGWAAAALRMLAVAHQSIQGGTALSEPYPVPPGFDDLAGPMTLFHVAAELLRALPENQEVRSVRDWAGLRLVTTHLTGPGWCEFAVSRPGLEGTLLARHVTPGHLLELLWMMQHARDQDTGALVPELSRLTDLALKATSLGWDQAHGGLLRYVDRHGGPPRGEALGDSPYESLVRSTWDTKLWWVHVEALYALHLLQSRAGDATTADELRLWARKVGDYTLRVFPADEGEWIQIRNRAGEPLDRVVALPVKDPFHIIRALLFLHRLELQTPSATRKGTA